MNKLFKKFVEFSMGNLLVFILGIVTLPMITRLVSTIEYGKASMFNTMCNLLLVVTILGIDQAYVRYVYEEKNRNDIFIQSLRASMISNLVIGIIIVFIYKPISQLIIGENSILVILLLLSYNNINIINRFSLLYIRMEQKSKTYSVIQVISKLLYLIFIYVLYNIFGDNYITIALAMVLSNLFSVIYMKCVVKIRYNIFSKVNTKVSSKELIKYGIPVAFATAITWLLNSTDKIILTNYAGYSEVGIYSGAFTIIGMLNILQGAFNTFWVPVANDKYVNDPNAKDFYILMNKIIAFCMILVSILMIIFRDIITVILGNNYNEAIYVFPFLVFVPLMNTVSETTVIGINFMKKTKYHILTGVLALVINLIGNIMLIPRYGAKGAAISTGVSYIVFYIARTYISKSLYNVNYKNSRYMLNTILLIGLAIYATFNKTDITLISMGVLCIIICIISYKDIFFMILENTINFLGRNRSELDKLD